MKKKKTVGIIAAVVLLAVCVSLIAVKATDRRQSSDGMTDATASEAMGALADEANSDAAPANLYI